MHVAATPIKPASDPFKPGWQAWVLFVAGAFALPIAVSSCDQKKKDDAAAPATMPAYFEPGPFGSTTDEKLVVSNDGSVAYLLINGRLFCVRNNVATEILPPK